MKVVHALVRYLPEGYAYDVVLVRRDLREVVASQEAMLARAGGAPGGPSPERMAEIFAQQLGELEDWLCARGHFRVLPVEHARVIAEPDAVSRALAAFVGRDLDVAAMAGAVDRALHRQRLAAAETKAPKSALR